MFLSLFLKLVVLSLFVGSVTKGMLFCLQISKTSFLLSHKIGLSTCIHHNRWCVSWTCIARNPLMFAPRRRFKNVLSIRSVRLCPKINWLMVCFFACFLNSSYLRFLSCASVSLSVVPFVLFTMISCVSLKNFLMNSSSAVFPGLTQWLQCIKNRFCKSYLLFIKKLYIKHAVNILSEPPLTAIISFWLGDTLLLRSSKHAHCWANERVMFFISLIVPVFFHIFFIKVGFEKNQ